MSDMTVAGKWIYFPQNDLSMVINGWSRSPQTVIDIVCDADHWTKTSAKGGTIRAQQFVVPISEAVKPGFEDD